MGWDFVQTAVAYPHPIMMGALYNSLFQADNLMGNANLREWRISLRSMNPVDTQKAVAMLQDGKRGIDKWNDWRRGVDASGEDEPLPDLRGICLRNADLRRVNLAGANLSQADLQGANLSESDLRGAKFVKTDLSRANLHNANLHKANLRKADLSESISSEANFAEADLTRASFTQASIVSSKFESAVLEKANLNRADLSGSWLERADLRDADLSSCVLTQANLDSAQLSSAILVDAKLNQVIGVNACFDGARLNRATLHGAKLQRSCLAEADLRGADLTKADLARADLSRADLREVDMTGATCDGALFIGTLGLFGRYPLRAEEMKGAENALYSWPWDCAAWTRLRIVGSLPLFGVSYIGIISIWIWASTVDLTNRYIALVREAEWTRHMQWVQTIPDIPVPRHMGFTLTALLLLAAGATLYRLGCPTEIQESTETRWLLELKRPAIFYRGLSYRYPTLRWITGVCYLIGGPWVLWLLARRVWETIWYLYGGGVA